MRGPPPPGVRAPLTPPKPRAEFWDGRILGIVVGVLLVLNVLWLLRLSLVGGGLRPGQIAPDFSLAVLASPGESTSPRPDGTSRLRLSDLRGKVVVLDFWATWCAPCLHAIPLLGRVNRRLGPVDGLVLGVDADPENTDPGIIRAAGQGYTILLDDQNVAERYRVGSFPTLFVIDREGRIRAVLHGLLTERDLEDELRSVLPPGGLPRN